MTFGLQLTCGLHPTRLLDVDVGAVVTSALTDTDGDFVAITFSEDLIGDGGSPALGDFEIRADGVPLTLTDYAGSGSGVWNSAASTVTFNLTDPILHGATVVFEYTPGVNPLKVVSTDEPLGSFTASVTNLVPALSVTDLGDGQLEVTNVAENGDLTITVSDVSSPSAWNGSYVVTPGDLDTGPVNLVAPVLTGDGSPAAGENLTITPGLWVYDADNDAPTITYTDDGAGAITDLSYGILAGDEGNSVTVTEQAAGTNGTRTADSNAVAIPATAITFSEDFGTYTSGQQPNSDADFTGVDNVGRISANASGNARVTGSLSETLKYTGDTLGNDQYCELEVEANGTGDIFAMVRWTGTFVYYAAAIRGGTLTVERINGFGTNTVLATIGAFSAPDTLRIEANGTTIRTLVGGVQQDSRTDANLANGEVAMRLAGDGGTEPEVGVFAGGEL